MGRMAAARAALELSGTLAAVGCNAGVLHAVYHVTGGEPQKEIVSIR